MSEAIAADELRLLIERIERMEEEKKAMADDIRDVYSGAKARGYDAKIMRKIIALRKMDANDRAEMEAILDTYMSALGMSGTPLGDYADARDKEVAAAVDMDVQGIGVSMKVGDGPLMPANQAALTAALQAAGTVQ